MEEEIKVNKNCVNAKIQAHILSEPEMRKIGFTDHAKDSWYFCRMLRFPKKKLYRDFKVSFSVTIPQNEDDIRIDVLMKPSCSHMTTSGSCLDTRIMKLPDRTGAGGEVDGLFAEKRCAVGTYPRRIYLILLLYEKYRRGFFV